MHGTKVLWPIHAVHHSDPDVTALTTCRVHIFESVVMSTSYIVLLSWLGFPDRIIGFGAVFLALHNAYVHVNVDWDHGPLRYVIASPRGLSLSLLNYERQASLGLILRSVLFDLKVRVCFGLGHAVLEGSSQDRKLLVGLEASERLLGLLEACGGPPEGHLLRCAIS